MRFTVHIPDKLAREVKTVAANEKTSVSSLTVQALQYYLTKRRRRATGLRVLELAGKGYVIADEHAALEEERRNDEHRH